MKISLGINLQSGPWGGGNQFGYALAEYLRNKGVEVFFDLNPSDLDLILLAEPRSHLKISAYSDKDIVNYLWKRNPKAIVVHRINECDERKGTAGVNKMLMRANFCADHTVFISSWLRDLFLRYGIKTPEHSVILNGASRQIFNAQKYKRWNGAGKLEFVTHHWGAGYLKGFDIYEQLDGMLQAPTFREKIGFTYIGNLPRDFRFEATPHIAPRSGAELADLLSSHHVYLTASQNEPAGMHHIEGAMSGLPLLFRESGALPEYCNGFGISFTAGNFEQKLHEMIDTYDSWVDRMQDYPHTAERMSEQYYDLFFQLLDLRQEIVERRNWWRRPLWFFRTALF